MNSEVSVTSMIGGSMANPETSLIREISRELSGRFSLITPSAHFFQVSNESVAIIATYTSVENKNGKRCSYSDRFKRLGVVTVFCDRDLSQDGSSCPAQAERRFGIAVAVVTEPVANRISDWQ
jgi:hypothetical protein